MRQCRMFFTGAAPYSASRPHQEPELPGENKDDYENRTWPSKAHVMKGQVFIPPMAFKINLDRATKMLGRQIPGKGKATYTKFFESGVMVTEPVFIAPQSAIRPERVYANTDGVRGSGKRVWRTFPTIDEWSGECVFYVLADEIKKEVLEESAVYAGTAVGVGRFRPERGGYFGRYTVDKFVWS